ncbi:MAG: hypothetical protein ABR874_12000 [Candidatus Sulfotelmatobacter sp.]
MRTIASAEVDPNPGNEPEFHLPLDDPFQPSGSPFSAAFLPPNHAPNKGFDASLN